jgi:hypothetical protein
MEQRIYRRIILSKFYFPIGIVFMASVVTAFYCVGVTTNVLGFERVTSEVEIEKIVLTGAALLLGIIFGVVNEKLSSLQPDQKISAPIIFNSLRTARAAKSLIAAPVLYVGVYTLAGEQPDYIVSFLLAFQNGFFCDAVMKDKKASV